VRALKSIITSLTVVLIIIYIGYLFYKESKIERYGIITTASINESRSISSNENGSSNIFFVLSFTDDTTHEIRTVKLTKTISTFYASQLQAGMQVKIKYLKNDPKELSFIFKKTE